MINDGPNALDHRVEGFPFVIQVESPCLCNSSFFLCPAGPGMPMAEFHKQWMAHDDRGFPWNDLQKKG